MNAGSFSRISLGIGAAATRNLGAAEFTAKRLNIIAQVSVGFCREAAIHHSPGLQPWVCVLRRRALKGR